MGERQIVIASRNKGKISEIVQIFADLPLKFLSLRDLPDAPEVAENGSTFAENARKKAIEIARATKEWALADDSGLEVDALNGRPGIHSARWSGGDDEANNDKLLAELKEAPAPARTARYQAVLCIASPAGKIIAESAGSCEGVIGFERRGAGGFGYDPLFVVPEYGMTMAELGADIKNQISHRAVALGRLRDALVALLGKDGPDAAESHA